MKCEYCCVPFYEGDKKCEGCGAPLPVSMKDMPRWTTSSDPGDGYAMMCDTGVTLEYGSHGVFIHEN